MVLMETHMNLHDTGPLKHTAEENSLDSFSSDFFLPFFIVSATILFFRLSLEKTMTLFNFLVVLAQLCSIFRAFLYY